MSVEIHTDEQLADSPVLCQDGLTCAVLRTQGRLAVGWCVMSVEIHTDEQLADSPVLQAVFGEALPQIEVFHGKLQAEGGSR